MNETKPTIMTPTGPILVPTTMDAGEANRTYGERYGIDWEYPTQDAVIRAEEVAAYQAQLEPPQGQQPGCAMPSDLFRAKSEDLPDDASSK